MNKYLVKYGFLILFLAPACAPEKTPPTKNLVFLTDTTQWSPRAIRDSLQKAGYRVLISGYPGETASELQARLPWLLQPGVDVLLYDPRLAGPATFDSLQKQLKDHPAEVKLWE
ncbi:MAG: hypothetical protein AAFZ52_10555 [Bacteroidota bacterium]